MSQISVSSSAASSAVASAVAPTVASGAARGAASTTSSASAKIGLLSLTALVVSSMIGSGIFALPQVITSAAGGQAIGIGWLITGVGIIFLGLSFFFLSRLRPDLDGGIYTYAREGFGELAGFLSAYGYWLCATIGITGYLVVAFEGVGVYTAGWLDFGKGDTAAAVIGASLVAWAVHWLVAAGLRQAAAVNLVATILKVLPLFFFIALVAYYFKPELFQANLSGSWLNQGQGAPALEQIKGTMLITLWVFTGIEGASVLSAHAKKRSHVGLATVLGVVFTLALYAAITILALGILPGNSIAGLSNPSMGQILAELIGAPGVLLITVCLVVSVLASYISWVLYSAEIPYRAALAGAFPPALTKLNQKATPINSLYLTTAIVQVCLLFVLFNGNSYQQLVLLSTSMILVPYIFVGLFLLQTVYKRKAAGTPVPWFVELTGYLATIYGLWIVYAAGLEYLLLAFTLYVPGIALFVYSRWRYLKAHKPGSGLSQERNEVQAALTPAPTATNTAATTVTAVETAAETEDLTAATSAKVLTKLELGVIVVCLLLGAWATYNYLTGQ